MGFDRVRESVVVSGTSTIALSGNGADGGFQSFHQALTDGQTATVCIQDKLTFAWEVCTCTYNVVGAAGTLTRGVVEASSALGNRITFSGNPCDVFVTIGAGHNQDLVTATGATVARTLADRAADTVNILEFGAVQNTDSTAAINACMTAAVAAGKPVTIPAGTFLITYLTPPAGCLGFVGQGAGVSVLKRVPNDTSARVLLGVNNSGFTVQNLTLDGNSAANTAFGAIGIYANGVSQLVLDGVEASRMSVVNGGYGAGAVLNNMTDRTIGTISAVRDCVFTGNGTEGLLIQGTGGNAIVTGCRGSGNGIGCHVSQGAFSATNSMANVLVSGNHFSKNVATGIFIGGYTSFTTKPVQYVTVVGNTCDDNGSAGIVLQCDQSICSSNMVNGNGYSGVGDCTGILANTTKCILIGNTVSNTTGFGADIGGSIDIKVTGNSFLSNSASPISAGALSGALISDNLFNNNLPSGQADISFYLYDKSTYAISTVSTRNVVRGNRFVLGSTSCYAINVDAQPNITITDNVFDGGQDFNHVFSAQTSGIVRGNVSVANPAGSSATAASTTIVPDVSDLVLLTGAATTINGFITGSQNYWAGRISGINLTAAGSNYTNPTATITGTGTAATASLVLTAAAPSSVGYVRVGNPGASYTSATVLITDPGGAGTGATATAVIGAAFCTDGRLVTVFNNSGAIQTLAQGASLQLAGGVNFALAPNQSITFAVRNGGVWYETARTGSGSSGTVTSVSASGGTTGLSFGGSPVFTSGTFTLTGILGVSNGGTGTTTSTGTGSVVLAGSPNLTGTTLVATLTASGSISSSGFCTFNSGTSFGSNVASSTSDLSKHLGIYGTVYGINVTVSRLNLVVPSSGAVITVVGGSDVMSVGSSGVVITGTFSGSAGIGAFGHTPPASQPAAPVVLADVIAIIRGCGLSA